METRKRHRATECVRFSKALEGEATFEIVADVSGTWSDAECNEVLAEVAVKLRTTYAKLEDALRGK